MISQTSEYALRAVAYLAEAEEGALVRVDEIAQTLDVPRNYLSKILHTLARTGVLTSQRGPRGGFRIDRDRTGITLAEVVSPFDDFVNKERRCLLGQESCSDEAPCAMHEGWMELWQSCWKFFQETTVADLPIRIPAGPGSHV